MTPKEALREICLSSHCVSEKLRIDLKPYQITERKNIIYKALTELEELKRAVKRYFETTDMVEWSELGTKLSKVGKEK